MITGLIVLNRVVNGNGYIIEEINTHEFYSIYEYTVYKNGIEVKKDTKMSIIDAVQSACEYLVL